MTLSDVTVTLSGVTMTLGKPKMRRKCESSGSPPRPVPPPGYPKTYQLLSFCHGERSRAIPLNLQERVLRSLDCARHDRMIVSEEFSEISRTSKETLAYTPGNLKEVELCLTAGGSPKGNTCGPILILLPSIDLEGVEPQISSHILLTGSFPIHPFILPL